MRMEGSRIVVPLGLLLGFAMSTHAVAQTVDWVPVRQVGIENDVAGRSTGRMTAADEARGVIVNFGCHYAQSGIADTWEWGGSHWTPHDPGRVPAWRSNAMFVHDPQRGRTVMFGGSIGRVNSFHTDQTWEWDGESWVLRTLPLSPSPRAGCMGAYDQARQRIVMFGGYSQGDTWEYDGSAWTLRFPANAPSARGDHSMIYDQVRQRVLLHGGYGGGGVNAETWEWDGTNWTLLATYGPAVMNHIMVWDKPRNRAVAVGYWQGVGRGTWEWDGIGWSVGTASHPFSNYIHTTQPLVAATDPELGAAVVFAAGTRWRWTGSAWLAAGSTKSTPRGEFPAPHCADTLRNRIVMDSSREGTWEWDGTRWTRGPYGPDMRYAAMAFDSGRGLSVLFGGLTWNGLLSNATFEWNGAAWNQRSFASQPTPRMSPAMAYDVARQSVVMFGGGGLSSMGAPPPVFGDTWTFNGTNWFPGASGPSARLGHQMAYDTARQVTVMFGGGDTSGPATPTAWEWNGTNWTQRLATVSPPARSGAAMAYDPTRGAVIVHGGANLQPLTDTWSWDGTNWTQINTNAIAMPRTSACMAFDSARQQLMLFGGFTPEYPNAYACCDRLDAAVLLTSPIAPTTTSVGSGCAAGNPPHLGSATPYLGNLDFAIELLDAAPNTLGLLGLSFTLQAQPLGPCTFYLGGASSMLTVITNTFGNARMRVPLLNIPAFAGIQLVAQGAALGNPGAYSGFDLTAARVLQLGN